MPNSSNHKPGQRNIGGETQQGNPPKKAPQHEQQDQMKEDQVKHQQGHGNRLPDKGKP